jgi:putative nucleotidyltransferase with HDIG domain
MRGRLRQFREASREPGEADYAVARERLSGAQFELFAAQHPRDIVHSAATARWLIDHGHDDPDLITAALLHDVGKGTQRRSDRVAYVLAEQLGVARLLAKRGSAFEIRRAIARSRGHSETSADMMARAGASERAVNLARRHHAPPGEDPVLALLQQADAAS